MQQATNYVVTARTLQVGTGWGGHCNKCRARLQGRPTVPVQVLAGGRWLTQFWFCPGCVPARFTAAQ